MYIFLIFKIFKKDIYFNPSSGTSINKHVFAMLSMTNVYVCIKNIEASVWTKCIYVCVKNKKECLVQHRLFIRVSCVLVFL